MSEYTKLFERAGARYEEPLGLSTEGLLLRRNRRRRTRRITAGIVGFAVFAAAVWIVTSGLPSDRTQAPAGGGETGPVETGPAVTGPALTAPTVTAPETWRVTERDIALGESFVDAWVDGDGETLAAMFSPDGTFDGFQPEVLPALHDWFRAGGWTFQGGGCGRHVDTSWEDDLGLGYVGCSLTYENDLTRALEMEPVAAGLDVFIDAGRIEAASTTDGARVDNMFRSPDPERLVRDRFGAVWDMFIDRISNDYPDDFGRMYDADRGYPLLDPRSIGLWERYTDEFVASPAEARRYFTEWMASQSFEAQAGRICVIATDRFWAMVGAGDLRGREFDSTLADISEERLAELLAVPLETEADRATMDAFVPLAEQLTELFRNEPAGERGRERLYLEHRLDRLIPGCWFGLGG